jgi:hypothetical protein
MSENTNSAPGPTDDGTTPVTPLDIEPRVDRRNLASPRACVIWGCVAFAIGVFLFRSPKISLGRTVFAAAFLGIFNGYGLWMLTKTRMKMRPPVQDTDRDPSQPPPAGGWANPTSGQTTMRQLGRSLLGLRRRR